MDSGGDQFPMDHYMRVLLNRKWWVLGVWLLVSLVTFAIAYRLPDVFMSETVILVDPQKVPESYVKATVTGDVRNRLGTLSQQILSSTRLQKIIESLNLYPEDRKKLTREDVITKMRADISVHVLSDFGSSQDLQAFRITYSGQDSRLAAQVTNQLANLFIEENLKAREEQATSTTTFLSNQLEETRKKLELQEAKLRDFRLKHIGEMPEQETADLQLLSQAQNQLQLESDALNRAEQQKSYIQSVMAQATQVVDMDPDEPTTPSSGIEKTARGPSQLATAKANLATLRSRYSDDHPDVKKLKRLIEEEEAREARGAAPAADPPPAVVPPVRRAPRPASHFNPVLQSQLKALDAEVANHKLEHERISKLVSLYRAKLDAIPVRQQEITALQRDYVMSKAHYSQLLESQLSAQMATQLEFLQKGEKFTVLDMAQAAERPSKPNRILIDSVGSLAGLILGILLATVKEFFGMSLIVPQEVAQAGGLAVLGVIPIIQTAADRRLRKRWILLAVGSMVLAGLACGAILIYRYYAVV